jgi:hypothetical protein
VNDDAWLPFAVGIDIPVLMVDVLLGICCRARQSVREVGCVLQTQFVVEKETDLVLMSFRSNTQLMNATSPVGARYSHHKS